MVKFEYTEDGRIFNLLEEFNSYQDPKIPIPEHITKLTGITDDMVKDSVIQHSKVAEYL
jgi:DNA polymerase-3 subunit epsilon